MKVEKRHTYYLTRPELIKAVAAYCGLPEETKIDNFWVKSESLAEPEVVAAIAYILKDSSAS